MDHEQHMFAQLALRLDPQARLLRRWPLAGGVSALVTALEIARPGGPALRAVVRRYGAADQARNPQIAADEHRLLALLRAQGVAAPAPLLSGPAGDLFPTPWIAIEYIDGTPDERPADLDDALAQLAALLHGIHRLDTAAHDLAFLPDQAGAVARRLAERPDRLDEALGEPRIRHALGAAWPPPPLNPPALLHGDFWPGNVLWRSGRLAAIIDWEDAATGDPLADLANARLELLWAFGPEAMRSFTERYRAAAPLDYSHLPLWDLAAALRPAGRLASWGLDPAAEQQMRERHGWFVEEAMRHRNASP